MKKLIITGIMLMLSATLLLPVAGCGGDNGEIVETEPATPENNRWLELLRILPENEATLNAAYLQTSEYAGLLQEQYPEALVLPGLSENTSFRLLAHNNLPLFGQIKYTDEEWKEVVGFTVSDVTDSIMATDSPAKAYQAVRGNFTGEDIETAAKTGPLQEFLEIKSCEGYEYYSWGEDMGIHLDWRSNIRRLGRGHRLAYVDGFALWELWDGGIEEMIDAYKGNIPSLADNEDCKLLAVELEKTNTVTAFFSANTLSIAEFRERFKENLEEIEREQPEQIHAFNSEPLLKPFLSIAAGAGEDENGAYLVIILLNDDARTATENAGLLTQRLNESIMIPYTTNPDMNYQKWTDNDAIQAMEIESYGRFTRAKLYGKVFLNWDQFNHLGFTGAYLPLLLNE